MKPEASRMIGSGVTAGDRRCWRRWRVVLAVVVMQSTVTTCWSRRDPRFWGCPRRHPRILGGQLDRRRNAAVDPTGSAPRDKIVRLARAAAGLGRLRRAVAEVLGASSRSTRSCWHTVDPGTVLFTGSLNRNVGCSGIVARRARVRDRGRQQVVVPRPQRPPRGRDQHRHPRRARRAAPGTARMRPTASATSCAARSSPTASTGARPGSCATRTSRGSPRPRSASSRR